MEISNLVKKIYKSVFLPKSSNGIPASGKINFGDLRRVKPLSRQFGFDRGGAVDRYYIENFLAKNASDVKGRVLEIKDDNYTRIYGQDKVTKADILDIDDTNHLATIIADLAEADAIPSNSYDCIILTQTLLLIYDVKAAISHSYRILKPGGVLLVTVPGIVQMDYKALGFTWYWSFTEASCNRLFKEFFSEEQVEVTRHGNVLAAAAQLYGISAKELTNSELDYNDPDYQMLITVRAVK
jgi:SAM-dependent methyltransferase